MPNEEPKQPFPQPSGSNEDSIEDLRAQRKELVKKREARRQRLENLGIRPPAFATPAAEPTTTGPAATTETLGRTNTTAPREIIQQRRNPSYHLLMPLTKELTPKEYSAAIIEVARQVQEDAAENLDDKKITQWAKQWRSFIQKGHAGVAYDIAHYEPPTLPETNESVSLIERARAIASGASDAARSFDAKTAWEITKIAGKTAGTAAVEGAKHVAKHPEVVKDAAVTYAKNYDPRGKTSEFIAGMVVGSAETAAVTYLLPVPGTRAIKSAVNFAAMQAAYGLATRDFSQREKTLTIELQTQQISREVFEQNLFDLRVEKPTVDAKLRNFAKGLSVGAGYAAIGINLEEIAVNALHHVSTASLETVSEKINATIEKALAATAGVAHAEELTTHISPLAENVAKGLFSQQDIQNQLHALVTKALTDAGYQPDTTDQATETLRAKLYGQAEQNLRLALDSSLHDLQMQNSPDFNPNLYKDLSSVAPEKWPQLLKDLQAKKLTGDTFKFAKYQKALEKLIEKTQTRIQQGFQEDVQIADIRSRLTETPIDVPSVTSEPPASVPLPPLHEIQNASFHTTILTDETPSATPASPLESPISTVDSHQAHIAAMAKLNRLGEKAGTAILAQPEVQQFLNTSVEKHTETVNAIAQKIAHDSGYELTGIPHEQTEQFTNQARALVLSMSGNDFNKALDDSIEELQRSSADPTVIAEVQQLYKDNPTELAGIMTRALSDPNSPEAQKYGFVARNFQSHLTRLWEVGSQDMILRGNLARLADANLDQIDQYINQWDQGQQLMVDLNLDPNVVHALGVEASEIGTQLSPTGERVVGQLAADPDFQELAAGRVGEDLHFTADIFNEMLTQNNLRTLEFTPAGWREMFSQIQGMLAQYGDIKLNVTLQHLEDADPQRLQRILDLKPEEFNEQLQAALSGQTNDFSPIVNDMQQAWQEASTNPQVRHALSQQGHQTVDLLRYYNHTYVQPPTDITSGSEPLPPTGAEMMPPHHTLTNTPSTQDAATTSSQPTAPLDHTASVVENSQHYAVEFFPEGKNLPFHEVSIPSGKTVGDLMVENGYNVTWGPKNAREFGMLIAANHNDLKENWDALVASGTIQGDYPFASMDDLRKTIIRAENGDTKSLKKLEEALHHILRGKQFKMIDPKDFATAEKAIGLPSFR